MISDEVLYGQLLGGDMDAFEELYRRYEIVLFGFIVRQVGDKAEAEDVFHEAFLAVLKERRAARQVKSFRAWLFEVARHLCLNRARSKQRARRAFEIAGDAVIPSELEGAHPEHLLAAKRAPEALARAIGALPGPLREVYALRASGLSYEEIAGALDMPVGTVKSRMHNMISRLKKEMQPWTAP